MNVQNIPRKDKVVKRAFIPKLDAFLFFDFKGIELRLLAYYLERCGHPSMAVAFKEGRDLHTETAKGVFGVQGEPTEEQRVQAKTLNFSVVYGGGTPTLIRQLGCDFHEANELLGRFHKTWPGIGRKQRGKSAPSGTLLWYIDKKIETKGYVSTLWGRQLHPETEHKRLNALVQGCAADLMRAALVKVHRHLHAHSLKSHLVNVVHDELILDCADDELEYLVQHVPLLMNHQPISEVVPIEVDCEYSATSWADKQPYSSIGQDTAQALVV